MLSPLKYYFTSHLESGIQRCNEIETAVVCNIVDAKGELAAAVASVEAIVSSLLTSLSCSIVRFDIFLVS